ncbi:SIR2 family NAD-dependent protein deacylase [Roseibium litorale]|uniref:protein acetyllysine N-acetyltransferase n=1 Tax=Roseibium litorale TaxID=2803841 RepID=A0ABR9CGR1_9HYPH|nr:Sir2 family NAD-dependent protein deacetylase [Roseibium litorale]MBD8889963.1 Sir2 family NAD-dependent protein deacetylase [Roseibium litorale]
MTEITEVLTARAELQAILSAKDRAGDPLRLVVMTGAGISTESGIPDFRSPGGLWSKIEPVTYQDFVRDERARLEDWRRRFEMKRIFDAAEPNAAHRVLAGLARSGRLDLLITQNVDGLHQRSGVPEDRLVEIHGNSTYATCLDCGAKAELAEAEAAWKSGHTPNCSACGGLLKAAVISFGQAMPEDKQSRAAEAAANADVFLAVGSSLVVQPAAQLPVIAARHGAELIIINREKTPLDDLASTLIRPGIAEVFCGLDQSC